MRISASWNVFGVLALVLVSSCSSTEDESGIRPPGLGNCSEVEPLRMPLFGDLHVHTSLSYDANLSGTRLGPRTAYAFARGERIELIGRTNALSATGGKST